MIEEVVHEFEYKARDAFKDFHKRSQRWAILVCHRRAGKTVASINDLIRRAIKEGKPDGRYFYLCPLYSQAKSVAWDYLLRFSGPALRKANQSELWVELVNGAKIRLFGADSPDSLRGNYCDGIVLDEYADMKPRVWGEIIRPALADRGGWATFIGTPKGHNGFWEIYNEAQKSPEWYSKTLRADQSGLLPQAELEDAQRMMSMNQYEAEFLCSFEAAIMGAYYGQEMRRLTDLERITKVEYDPMFKVSTAWDLGYTDSTSIWFFQVIHGEIRVLEYFEAHGQAVPFYTGVINSKDYVYDTHWLPHDARAKTMASGGKSVIEQISDKIPLNQLKIVPNLSVQDGIQASRMALLRCWFDAEKCNDGIECLRQYQREYDDDKKMFRDKPRHDFASHGADAFRMLSIAWSEKSKEIEIDKPIKGVTVGKNEVTMDELWASTPKPSNGRI
jgi:phage terminase large subunit